MESENLIKDIKYEIDDILNELYCYNFNYESNCYILNVYNENQINKIRFIGKEMKDLMAKYLNTKNELSYYELLKYKKRLEEFSKFTKKIFFEI